MTDRKVASGKFEFVTIAGRVRVQLLKGLHARTSGHDKVVKLAQGSEKRQG